MGIRAPELIRDRDLLESDDLDDILASLGEKGLSGLSIEASLLDYQIDQYPTVVNFDVSGDEVKYEFDIDWPADFPDEEIATQQDRVRDAFVRSGVMSHLNLPEVMEELRSQDDVILGIDGNMLNDSVLTASLLGEIYEEAFPNWILVGIPKLVVNGIERAAKDEFTETGHPLIGWPTYRGRLGQHALQEVAELRKENTDRPGLSVATIGDMDDRTQAYDENDWRLDAKVRDQFRQFIDDIGYQKGSYFLSQDRVSVMITSTEGSAGLHLQKPEYNEVMSGSVGRAEFAELLQELCVQFGSIRMRSEQTTETLLELSIYWPGKRVSDWENQRLNIVSTNA